MSSEQDAKSEKTEDEGTPEKDKAKQEQIHPLLVQRHAKYFERVLNILPGTLSSLDSNRYYYAASWLTGWLAGWLAGCYMSFKRSRPVYDALLCRMTLAFFGLSGLDMLGALDTTLSAQRKKEIVDWVYSHQILPSEDGNLESCGFRGSNFIGAPFYDYEV